MTPEPSSNEAAQAERGLSSSTGDSVTKDTSSRQGKKRPSKNGSRTAHHSLDVDRTTISSLLKPANSRTSSRLTALTDLNKRHSARPKGRLNVPRLRTSLFLHALCPTSVRLRLIF